MSKEKVAIRYSLREISLVENFINSEALKSIGTNELENQMEISTTIDAVGEQIVVSVAMISLYKTEVYVKIRVNNVFFIKDIKKRVVTVEGKLLFNDRKFIHHIVDISIGHLRGIQAIKMGEVGLKNMFVPFTKAEKLLTESNLTKVS